MNMNLGDTALIISVGRKHGLLRNQLAYVLATAYHETAHTMKPVRETLATTDAQAVSRLNNAWSKGQLGSVKNPYWRDGWFGRGYVQLTHKANYEKSGKKIGVDLVANPARAMDPAVAAEILVLGSKDGWFTTKKLEDYITLQKSDFVGARRIINGTDKASLIAGYAEKYDADLNAMGYGVTTTVPVPDTKPVVISPPIPDDPGVEPAPISDSKTGSTAVSIGAAIVLAVGGLIAILFGVN